MIKTILYSSNFRPSTGSIPIFYTTPVIIGTPTASFGWDSSSTQPMWDSSNWDPDTTSFYSIGSYGGTPFVIMTQQWNLNGVPISGAINSTYIPTIDQVNGILTVTQILTNPYGSISNTSSGIPIISGS